MKKKLNKCIITMFIYINLKVMNLRLITYIIFAVSELSTLLNKLLSSFVSLAAQLQSIHEQVNVSII